MKKLALPLLMTTGLLQGCLNDSDGGNSTLTLGLTDAPVHEASEVVVQFSGVEFKTGSEQISIDFDEPQSINLLDYQGAQSVALLDNETMPAGKYQWVRLKVDTQGLNDSYIIMADGASYELSIPSGSESGLKLVQGFTLPENGSADFTIDFDVRKSMVENNNGYSLKPALRLVDNVKIGHISGSVASEQLTNCAAPSVYAYEGADVTPVEEGDASTAVVASSLVDDQNQYEIGYLLAGVYTLAFTCDADTAESGDTVNFSETQNVTVVVDTTVTADFQ